MLWNLTSVLMIALAGIALYWMWPRITAALKQFDAENRDRIVRQWQDRRDSSAHVRHTLEVAGEQVEEIVEIKDTDARTGTPVTRYSFEGIWYATRDEAERMRMEKIGDIARGFYRDLPAALAARKRDGRLN
ncbi:hypothetical protein [Rhizomicrobium electricum]|uniref:Uncharacterized protein n=1 Tax=Rhizomicrobium electricum TaxID=480070 RepID=A0ABP3Q6Z8_9PROT|nr:hypothetical protein [Rhizomicrobium electricum]NIJ49414.1 hypothetical protein [Rhizomicrobium electricum]